MSTEKKTPYDFIQRNYREPKTDDPIQKWLPHPEVARAICGTLFVNGVRRDLEDRLQDVYVKVLTAFREGETVPPQDLRAMKAYCATAAKNLVIDLAREAEKRKRDMAEPCEREDYGLAEPDSAEPHDRVDASTQVEVIAQLFRDGRMPRDGVAILQGVAAGRSYAEIARDLKISKNLVVWRMGKMRQICRQRMAELGMRGELQPLEVVVSNPSTMTLLRSAA